MEMHPWIVDQAECQKPAPLVASLKRNTLVFDVTNNVEPSSPQARFPVGTPVSMLPKCLPSGEMTWMPPGPTPKMFPSRSTFMPSGTPGLLLVKAVALNRTRPFSKIGRASCRDRVEDRTEAEIW